MIKSIQNPKSSTPIKAYFYGSLRAGEYNYKTFVRIFGEENFVYKGTKTINGFRLHSLGSYPAIIPDSNKSVVVDEFEISEKVYNSVRSMELGAGYKEAIVDGAYIYHFEPGDSKWLGEEVTSGDWSQYLKDKNGIH